MLQSCNHGHLGLDRANDWRLCRDMLHQENGASTFMLYYHAAQKDLGHPANYPLLHDVYLLAQMNRLDSKSSTGAAAI